MKMLNLLVFAIVIAFCFSPENAHSVDQLESLRANIVSIERETDSDKANILRSLARMNIQYLENRSNDIIRKAERNLDKYKERLQNCKDNQTVQYWLDKIKSSEDKIKTHREFQCNLDRLKIALLKDD
jgi:hypothetical protein